MATLQVGGSAVTNTSTKNNIGTIRHGGVIGSTLFTSHALGDNGKAYTSGVKMTNGSGLAKALEAGTFAYMAAANYVIRKVTSTLSGVANSVLLSGASDYGQRNAIHKSESARTTFLSALSWSANPGGLPTYTFTKSDQFTGFGNDDAARPSLAVPGELIILPGGKTPDMVNYKAKTSA
jgi:hypothetical protein